MNTRAIRYLKFKTQVYFNKLQLLIILSSLAYFGNNNILKLYGFRIVERGS